MIHQVPETIGERIVKARKLRGLLQKELAQKIGVTPTALNYYEKNKRNPSIYIVSEIAVVLDVSIEYLLGVESIDAKKIYSFLKEGQYQNLENEL